MGECRGERRGAGAMFSGVEGLTTGGCIGPGQEFCILDIVDERAENKILVTAQLGR